MNAVNASRERPRPGGAHRCDRLWDTGRGFGFDSVGLPRDRGSSGAMDATTILRRWPMARSTLCPGCFAKFESEMKSDFSAEMFRATETFCVVVCGQIRRCAEKGHPALRAEREEEVSGRGRREPWGHRGALEAPQWPPSAAWPREPPCNKRNQTCSLVKYFSCKAASGQRRTFLSLVLGNAEASCATRVAGRGGRARAPL